MKTAAVILAAYLIGAVPTGLLVGKIGYGIDIRRHGSGNIGSTNVQRVLGMRAGLIVLAIDVFKGGLAVAVPAWLWARKLMLPVPSNPEISGTVVLAAIAVLFGNMFSVFIKGRGGKGVGVATGVLFAIVPLIAAILLAVWLTVRQSTRYVSLASMTIAVLFPVLVSVFYRENKPYLVFSIVAALLVFFSHRANIKRLLAGTEHKIGAGAGDG